MGQHRLWIVRVAALAMLALAAPPSQATAQEDNDATADALALRTINARRDHPKTLLEWRGPARVEDDEPDAPEEDEPLATDRPDFTEASSTVGRGRVQIESGYTYFFDDDHGVVAQTHSFPEVLARIGLFRDWFELRLGVNHVSQSEEDLPSLSGAQDMYLGVKLALVEQRGVAPEMAIMPQMFLPTGHGDLSDHQALPGVNLLYSWELSDRLSLAGSTQVNRRRDGAEHYFMQTAQSASVGVGLADRVGGYFEWFALFPTGSIDPDTGPEYYINGGLTFLLNNNLQLDVRVGHGLNQHADDLFAGAGASARF
jgi:hypothetical protein